MNHLNIRVNWADHHVKYTAGRHWTINGKRSKFSDVCELISKRYIDRTESHFIDDLLELVEGQFSELGLRRLVNAVLRACDQSELYPINGKFDATERAIRKTNRIEKANGTYSTQEYVLSVVGYVIHYVNKEV